MPSISAAMSTPAAANGSGGGGWTINLTVMGAVTANSRTGKARRDATSDDATDDENEELQNSQAPADQHRWHFATAPKRSPTGRRSAAFSKRMSRSAMAAARSLPRPQYAVCQGLLSRAEAQVSTAHGGLMSAHRAEPAVYAPSGVAANMPIMPIRMLAASKRWRSMSCGSEGGVAPGATMGGPVMLYACCCVNLEPFLSPLGVPSRTPLRSGHLLQRLLFGNFLAR